MVEIDISADDGHSYVSAQGGRLYRVYPKKARVVRMQKGDFKTAYGVAEVKDPNRFDVAYHRYEAVT